MGVLRRDLRRHAAVGHRLAAAQSAFLALAESGGSWTRARGNYDTDSLIQVLDEARRSSVARRRCCGGRLPAHRSAAMQRWLTTQRARLVVKWLPAYAPDLNPVEGLWSYLKTVELANLTGSTLPR